MSVNTVNPGKTALLFFDFLNGHVKKNDPKNTERYAPVIKEAQKLLAWARSHDMMIVYAHANHRADNATTAQLIRDTDNRLRPVNPDEKKPFKPVVEGGSWESQIIDELAPEPQDYLIPKYRWSAFFQTYLDLALRTRGVDTLILAGGSTDVGVASTGYSARDLDYNVIYPSDACTSPEYDNHDQFMQRIFPRMGRVRTVDEITQMDIVSS